MSLLRELTAIEQSNVAFLTRFNVDFGLLEVTKTGLGKKILDATGEFRAFLDRNGIHDYESQLQGMDDKRYISGHFLAPDGESIPAQASLYRPVTKKGDPRVWFSKLHRYLEPGNVALLLWLDRQFWILDLAGDYLERLVEQSETYAELLGPAINPQGQVFVELLDMLTGLYNEGFVPAIKQGDTAIGHLVETRLGIKQNSHKAPDYKGVELKSTRARFQRNQTLFAKVADWDISPLTSSGAILDNFGYERGPDLRKLYCTVSTLRPNSQGLYFQVNEAEGHLMERSTSRGMPEVARWRLGTLRDTLAAKHADTFWIKAETRRESGQEYLWIKSVIQTSRPVLQQFVPLLERGQITMDHLIKRQHGKTSEKGPLFKIAESGFGELFPSPVMHDLSIR